MLAPTSETIADDALHDLCRQSLRLYPVFVDDVQAASGLNVRLQLGGVVQAVFSEGEFAELRQRQAELRERGIESELLDRASTLTQEPALSGAVAGSLVVNGEGQVDNRRLGRALVAACERRGVRVYGNAGEVEVECDGRRVRGVSSQQGFVAAGAVVNAAGAAAAQISGVPAAFVPTMRPVKGQMVALEVPRDFVRRVLWVPGAYFVPRDDGRLLIGATSEDDASDERVTANGVHTLLHATLQAAPALRDFTVSETWAGVRPGTADGKPYMGPTPLDGYFLATGHYRNGILLAPVTATLLADAIEGRGEACAPFTLQRGVPATLPRS
jgi:glycine oxidase